MDICDSTAKMSFIRRSKGWVLKCYNCCPRVGSIIKVKTRDGYSMVKITSKISAKVFGSNYEMVFNFVNAPTKEGTDEQSAQYSDIPTLL